MPIAPEARIIDEAKRCKSTLAHAICNPFWDDAPQQEPNAHYPADKADVSGSSVAEATARVACLLSFIRSLYEKHPVVVTKDGVAIPVGNIWKEKQLYSIPNAQFKQKQRKVKMREMNCKWLRMSNIS